MNQSIKSFKKQLLSIFKKRPEIKLVYIFGSQATREVGPLSDYDFALYLDENDKKKIFEIKIDVLNQISRALGTDKVDVVILNTAEMPELKYNIIKEGKLIFKKEPFKILVEPRILNEYFDFRMTLKKSGLINA